MPSFVPIGRRLVLLCVVAVAALGCHAQPRGDRASGDESRVARSDRDAAAPAGGEPRARPDNGFVTIPFTSTAECPGGVWMVDGLVQGGYPVERHPVPAGARRIAIESRDDCAGYGALTVRIEAGVERELPPEQFRR